MAYGIEVLLGWKFDRFEDVQRRLDFRLPLTNEDWESAGDVGHDDWLLQNNPERFKAVNEGLAKAHRLALEDLGYKFLRPTEDGYRAAIYEIDGSEQEFHVWGVGMHYDHSEMDEMAHDAVFGIELSSRYKPIFLDHQSPHGTLDRFTVDAEFRRMIQIAHQALTVTFPFPGGFSSAEVHVKLTHY